MDQARTDAPIMVFGGRPLDPSVFHSRKSWKRSGVVSKTPSKELAAPSLKVHEGVQPSSRRMDRGIHGPSQDLAFSRTLCFSKIQLSTEWLVLCCYFCEQLSKNMLASTLPWDWTWDGNGLVLNVLQLLNPDWLCQSRSQSLLH